MSHIEKNPHYNGRAIPGTPQYWVGAVLLGPSSRLGPEESVALETVLFNRLHDDEVPPDVKFYSVDTVTAKTSGVTDGVQLCLELGSPYPRTAAETIVGVALHAVLELDSRLFGDLQVYPGSLVNGWQLHHDRERGVKELPSDYTGSDPEIERALSIAYKALQLSSVTALPATPPARLPRFAVAA